ncbi:MAG: AAA family ATPase [Actinomycetia bacterium]|nr:AAA family ATPase [Actinomycetes bacterium]
MGESAIHPELESEQTYIDRAFERLEATRRDALRLQNMVETGRGGTNQARWEREVFQENIVNRLSQLNLGDQSLVFGRLDFEPDSRPPDDPGTYYIGRMAVSDENQDVMVVDWRAPIAEAFYRATGPDPMDLRRRRHFASRGHTLIGLDDEVFGPGSAGNESRLAGYGALISALEESRTGRLNDIVATIQGEQDQVIRSALPGILVVQGGPGTGKTVVALHRAAYLLYSHRFPLEGQGVLVLGPNRLFLGYIEQVLPSLGEAGVQLSLLADLLPEVAVRGSDPELVARIKGDLKVADVLARAIRDRQRPLRADARIAFGLYHLRLTVERSTTIINEARRRFRTHNAGRRYVVAQVYEALAESHPTGMSPEAVRERLRTGPEIREILEWMWPLLSPAHFLHDLLGSRALLRSAGRREFSDSELDLLHRDRSAHASKVIWTSDDVPLLDEARAVLGKRPSHKLADEIRTYGHIVIDEAQDLSPMELRMVARRSLNGSLTIVGDIAQSTGAWAHNDWGEILEHLPERHPPRLTELTLGYRIPGPSMDLAARVLAVAAPQLTPPRSVRDTGDPPRVVRAHADLLGEVVAATLVEVEAVGTGSVGVICPRELVDPMSEAFDRAGIEHGRAARHGLESQITVVPVGLVKGLELDGAVVVEPADIIDQESQGMRALYVAVTRATKRLTLVHQRDLPKFLEVRHQVLGERPPESLPSGGDPHETGPSAARTTSSWRPLPPHRTPPW